MGFDFFGGNPMGGAAFCLGGRGPPGGAPIGAGGDPIIGPGCAAMGDDGKAIERSPKGRPGMSPKSSESSSPINSSIVANWTAKFGLFFESAFFNIGLTSSMLKERDRNDHSPCFSEGDMGAELDFAKSKSSSNLALEMPFAFGAGPPGFSSLLFKSAGRLSPSISREKLGSEKTARESSSIKLEDPSKLLDGRVKLLNEAASVGLNSPGTKVP